MNSSQLRGALGWAALLVCLLARPAAAEQPYLDDANPRRAAIDGSLPNLLDDFPRVLTHELQSGVTPQEYSKYQFITTKGDDFPIIEKIQHNFSPDTKMLRHISGRAYQSFNFTYCNISAGLAFETTTSKSQGGPRSTGCGIYAGHWLYKAGTRLRQGVGADVTTLPVENPGRIHKGMYVVIYDAPAGSFRNAEHARVTGVNSASKTITVKRGYKSGQSWHSSGSIVAEHVLGQGDDPELWAFNLSTESPQDDGGRTFGEFYADWIGQNLLRHSNGARTSADVAGVMFDADFYYDYSSTASDANNDLVTDNGVGPHGQNWLGNGLDAFYQRVKLRLPGYYVLVGVHDARGFDSAQGGQMESWLDYGNDDFNPNPKYAKLSKLFAAYLFNMSERRDGPPLVMNLSKTPTREYPAGTSANSNAPFRLALTMTLLEDGYFGTHTLTDPDVWWDEYAVDVRPGSANFGKAVRKGDVDGIHQHRGWLGKPIAPFRRVYNDADFAPAKSLIGASTFEQGLNGWDSTNVSISRVTSGARDGSGALRASDMNRFTESEMGAFVKSTRFNVSGGATYTLAFSARASDTREIRVGVGNHSYRIAIGKEWRRYVLTFRPTQSGATVVKFGLGREDSQVWLDSAYLFKRDADVFQREFENGMVLANATASSKTISIGPGFRRINGTQDPVNDGKAVSRVTLPPYDGIVLVRDGDAGSPGNSKIGDLVWRDADGDGRRDGNESGWAGLAVKLLRCNGNVIATTTTNSNGKYLFDGLGEGSYRVQFVRPTGTTFSPYRVGGSAPDNSDADRSTGLSWCVKVTDSGQSNLGIDAGLVPSGADSKTSDGGASIGDLVWKDADGDGRRDGNESGVSNVAVQLRDCSGLWIGGTTTSAGGSYLFEGLDAGDYMIRFVAPNGVDFTSRQAGADDSVDSNADAQGWTQCMTLPGTGIRRGVDAGLVF